MTGAPVVRAFDGEGKALAACDHDLTEAEGNGFAFKGIVVQGEPTEADAMSGSLIGRCWVLAAGATFDRVAPAERLAALAILRTGQAVLLLADDERAEASVRCGLLNLLDLDKTPRGRVGHA